MFQILMNLDLLSLIIGGAFGVVSGVIATEFGAFLDRRSRKVEPIICPKAEPIPEPVMKETIAAMKKLKSGVKKAAVKHTTKK